MKVLPNRPDYDTVLIMNMPPALNIVQDDMCHNKEFLIPVWLPASSYEDAQARARLITDSSGIMTHGYIITNTWDLLEQARRVITERRRHTPLWATYYVALHVMSVIAHVAYQTKRRLKCRLKWWLTR